MFRRHVSRSVSCWVFLAGLLSGGLCITPDDAAGASPTEQQKPANQTIASQPVEIPADIQQAEEKAAALHQQQQAAEAESLQAAEQVATLKQRVQELENNLPIWTKSVTEMAARLKTEQAAAGKAQAAQEKAVQKKADEKELKAAEKSAREAADQVQKSEMELQDLKQRIAAAGPEKTRVLAEIAKLEQTEKSAAAASRKLLQAWRTQEQQIEQLLKKSGLWVSFSDEIAPVLASRCLACHSSKKAAGGLNLESYATLQEGGESGVVIDLKDRQQSSLLTLISDGSMPKDADPLPPEEVALFARWVQTGGRLNQGVKATAELIQVIPRSAQPAPPATYRAPLSVTALAFSPDGTVLASSGYHEVQLWDTKTASLVRRISNLAERIYRIEFSPDGKLIAVAAGSPGRLGEVKVFQAADGALTADLLITSEVQLGVAFSPDGTRLAACGADRKLRVFEIASKSLLLETDPHLDWATNVSWSADGKSLLTCGMDKTARIMDAESGHSIIVFNGHSDVVNAAAFLPGGTEVVSAGADKVLRVWSISDAREVRKIGGFGGEISALTVLPDQKVISAGLDHVARVHQITDGKQALTFAKQPEPLYTLAAHPKTGLAATGSRSGEVQLWSLSDGKSVRKWLAIPPSPPKPVSASSQK